jgi:hypothetical protein
MTTLLASLLIKMGNLWRKRPPKMPVDASQKGMRIYQIGGWYGSKNDHLVDVCNLLTFFRREQPSGGSLSSSWLY